MNPAFVLFCIFLTNAPFQAAISYSTFAHPKGDYVIQYPSDWKRVFGIQSLGLKPQGADSSKAKISLELYPSGKKSPKTPKAFIAELLKQSKGVKKLETRGKITVAGKNAERLSLIETVPLKGEYGQILPGPMKEIYVIVRFGKKKYYVLKLEGIGNAFQNVLPEFERIVQTIKLGI